MTSFGQIQSLCDKAGNCYDIVQKTAPGLLGKVAQYVPYAQTAGSLLYGAYSYAAGDKAFQYKLLSEELVLARKMLQQFDIVVKKLEYAQKIGGVNICPLGLAKMAMKHFEHVLTNFSETRQLQLYPEYYRELLGKNVQYLSATTDLLQLQASTVLHYAYMLDQVTDETMRRDIVMKLQQYNCPAQN